MWQKEWKIPLYFFCHFPSALNLRSLHDVIRATVIFTTHWGFASERVCKILDKVKIVLKFSKRVLKWCLRYSVLTMSWGCQLWKYVFMSAYQNYIKSFVKIKKNRHRFLLTSFAEVSKCSLKKFLMHNTMIRTNRLLAEAYSVRRYKQKSPGCCNHIVVI